jgi:hypothetical protein
LFRYRQAVIIPPEEYVLSAGEIKPNNITPEQINAKPAEENESICRSRIECIIELRASKMFDVDNVVSRVVSELFEGLLFGKQDHKSASSELKM